MVFLTYAVSIHGLDYRAGCALVLDYTDDVPSFAVVNAVIVADHTKYFVVTKVNMMYDKHILSYVICDFGEEHFVPYSKLAFKWPLSVYSYNGKQAVMNVNSHCYAYPF